RPFAHATITVAFSRAPPRSFVASLRDRSVAPTGGALAQCCRMNSRLVGCFAVVLAGCGAGVADLDGDPIAVDDETAIGVTADSLTSTLPIGSTLVTTDNLNLRSGPSTSDQILRVIPSGDRPVTVNRGAPVNGFYNVAWSGSI